MHWHQHGLGAAAHGITASLGIDIGIELMATRGLSWQHGSMKPLSVHHGAHAALRHQPLCIIELRHHGYSWQHGSMALMASHGLSWLLMASHCIIKPVHHGVVERLAVTWFMSLPTRPGSVCALFAWLLLLLLQLQVLCLLDPQTFQLHG